MKVAIKTFGCRLNRAESVAFEEAFAAEGIEPVRYGESAEIIVLHSCAVTQKAQEECVHLLRTLRERQPYVMLVVVGCAVETASAEALYAAGANLIVTRADKHDLARMVVAQLLAEHGELHRMVVRAGRRRLKRAYLKVQDGCDFFCTYCIIPHTRGAPVSRAYSECLAEARERIAAGYEEVVVTGCNLACYSDSGRGLVELLAALSALPGLGRLRLSSIEPGTVEREVVELMAEMPKICRFLHLPVQSGDDDVLQAMGRRYSVAQIRSTVQRARDLMPQIGLGADFICGFPGESEAAFARSEQVACELAFNNLHVFPYSERPGTRACTHAGAVEPSERRRRTRRLIEAGASTRHTFANSFVGREVEVLVEHFDRQGRARGWSGEYLPCAIVGVPAEGVGKLYRVRIEEFDDGLLCGHYGACGTC